MYVNGAVAHPAVYTVESGDLAKDAIERAGKEARALFESGELLCAESVVMVLNNRFMAALQRSRPSLWPPLSVWPWEVAAASAAPSAAPP